MEAPLKEHIQKAFTGKGIPDFVGEHIIDTLVKHNIRTFKDLLKMYEEGNLKEKLIEFISEGRTAGIVSIKSSENIVKIIIQKTI